MSKVKMAMVARGVFALAAPALADDTAASVRDLRTARDSVARAADLNDGQARQALLDEQRRLDAMIEQLEDGNLGRTTNSGPPSVR
jgi:hypothetical protein